VEAYNTNAGRGEVSAKGEKGGRQRRSRSETVHKIAASGRNGSGWTWSKKNGGEIPATRRRVR